MKNINKILIFTFCLLTATISFSSMDHSNAATVQYVNANTGDNSYDGTSPTHTTGSIGPKKTIQNAINSISSGGTIYVANGIYKEHLSIKKNVNIIGTSSSKTIIDGSYTYRVVTINQNAEVNISKLTIQKGAQVNEGGGIHNKGYLTIDNCIIQKNKAKYDGGGICTINGFVTLKNCIIYKNTAYYGGGVENLWGSMIISKCNIYKNTAKSYGGGIISIGNNKITIYQTTIQYNIAKQDGGGIQNSDGSKITIKSCKIYKNKAKYYGGGIFNGGKLTIQNSNIYQNTGKIGKDICNYGSKIKAKYNWWGSKSPKFSRILYAKYGKIIYTPWLKKKAV